MASCQLNKKDNYPFSSSLIYTAGKEKKKNWDFYFSAVKPYLPFPSFIFASFLQFCPIIIAIFSTLGGCVCETIEGA